MKAMDMDSFGQDDDLKDQLGSSLKESLDTSEVHGEVAPSGTEATHTEPEKKVGKNIKLLYLKPNISEASKNK